MQSIQKNANQKNEIQIICYIEDFSSLARIETLKALVGKEDLVTCLVEDI